VRSNDAVRDGAPREALERELARLVADAAAALDAGAT